MYCIYKHSVYLLSNKSSFRQDVFRQNVFWYDVLAPKIDEMSNKVNEMPDKLDTLSGQKYFNTTKYPCTDCAVYRLNTQLGAKMGIEICK